MLSVNPIIHPDTKNKQFKFEPFLRREFNFGLDPDRPVCQYYNPQRPTNSCPNGVNCPNKHVSSMYNNKIVCKHWLRGLCKKNDHCEFLHEYNLRKMPECIFYSKNGFCTQTPECLYLHVDPLSKIPPCPNYDMGFCPDGPKCSKRHTRKVLCPLYLTGFCPSGPDCQYAHPRFDLNLLNKLRIKPDQVRLINNSDIPKDESIKSEEESNKRSLDDVDDNDNEDENDNDEQQPVKKQKI
ncbi:mRNA 3'-end-processing protein YTH1 [Scheffersomyces coipomensis]|uniref:mRNA 3'-end-processing protein YTH1 n=1 Tax=Scheffersomyces coipomensis TaxID=1788519 RepID=UPI00315D2732